MQTATVLRKFIDKKSREKYVAGDEYQGSKERLEELIERGFVEIDKVAAEEAKRQAEEKAKKEAEAKAKAENENATKDDKAKE